MKFNKWILGLAAVGAICLTSAVRAQTNAPSPIPPQLAAQLPANMPAFNPAGLSFTNVNYKVASGTVLSTGSGGTLAYLQADEDVFHFSALDIGFGQEATLSSSGNGVAGAAVAVEFIKNLSNWQLVGKVGYDHTFEGTPGNYGQIGVDVNYNLTAGTGLAFLGTSGGGFTYVGAGVDYGDRDFSLNQADVVKTFRVYAGFAF